MAGIKQKSATQKKLEGTYRKDRDKENLEKEIIIKETAIPSGTEAKLPEEISDPNIKSLYLEHFERLTDYGLLVPSDLIEFNQIYIFAQQIQDLYTELKKQNISQAKGFEKYQHITYVILKLSARLSDLAKKYYISPVARQKMTLNELDIKKKTSENESVISKLISRSK